MLVLGQRAPASDLNDAQYQSVSAMGYSEELQVERLLREVLVCRIAPITEQLILSFIREKVSGPAEIVLGQVG